MGASREEIVDHWASVEDECGLAVDWSEAHERCWRCGYKSRLEKCNIVPASLGGGASADNLVLLCGRCHREAPNHHDPAYMWRWLRATCVPLYDTYWTIRGWEEFEIMFGRKPLTHFLEGGIDGDTLVEDYIGLMNEEFARTVIHFGEGRLNPSTVACIIAEIEKTLARRYGIALPDSPAVRARRGIMATL